MLPYIQDDANELLSLLRGAAGTPLGGMTVIELEEVTRLNSKRVRDYLERLVAANAARVAGKRNGQDVYAIVTAPG